MLLTPLPLIIGANAAVGRQWANTAIWILGGVPAGITLLFGALDLAGVPMWSPDLSQQTRFALDAGFVVTGFAAAGFVFKPIRKDIAAFLPIDPESPVDALALVLAVILLGTQVTSFAFTDVLATDQSQPVLNLVDIVLQEAPFLILGLAGVGIFMRRSPSESAARLGLVLPAWWQVVLALAAAGAFYAFSLGMSSLSESWTPAVAHKVDSVNQHLFGGLAASSIGIMAVALIPGICEEVLFRGALQPRLGLVFTALLFASIHTQYGLSLDALAILTIAIGLGLIRKYANTTSSGLCHITYNLLAGFGLAGWSLNAAIGAELVLAAILVAYAIRAGRTRGAAPANP